MKRLTLTIFVFLVSTPLLALENCTEANLSPSAQAEELAEQNCDVVDKMSSCAEKQIDPDAAKKRIEALLSRAESGEFQKSWSYYKSNPSISQLFTNDKTAATTMTLIDWLSDSKYSGTETDKEAIKETIVKKYVDYAKKFDCTPLLKHGFTHQSYPSQVTGNTLKELQAQVEKPDVKAAKDEHFKKYNERTTETLSSCNPARYSESPWQNVANLYPPCSGNVSGLFKDNVANVSTLDKTILESETNEVSQCIKQALAKGAKIHHVSISSSASALNNTGEAAKKYCKKGFLALSQARAESARDKILPEIFSKAGQADYDYSSKIEMNFKGSNGDGTSGACPYTIVNGKEVLKEEFRTPEGKKDLDENKFVRIHVTFEDSMKRVTNSKPYFAPFYSCKRIYFECAPK